MQVYWSPWTMWWASLGPGVSQIEHCKDLTLARWIRSCAFSLLFKGHSKVHGSISLDVFHIFTKL